MFEKNARDVTNQDLFISFMLNRLDTVNHANIFAHLKSQFSYI